MFRTSANKLLRSAAPLHRPTSTSASVSGLLRTQTSPLVRSGVRSVARPLPVTARLASTQVLSKPTLANIEKRWERMPPQEQAELWMALRDRMKGNWKELTPREQQAAYWVAFGAHGPRAEEEEAGFWATVGAVSIAVAVSAVILAIIRYFARDPPHTMTQEWQEESNKILIAQRSDPLTGISSEGYSGKGQVQSPPAKS